MQSYYQQQQTAPVQQPSQQQPQYQANQSVQPQPQQQYQPENNIYRQPSPGVITLRKELPVSQRPPLVYASEPAAHSFGGMHLIHCTILHILYMVYKLQNLFLSANESN